MRESSNCCDKSNPATSNPDNLPGIKDPRSGHNNNCSRVENKHSNRLWINAEPPQIIPYQTNRHQNQDATSNPAATIKQQLKLNFLNT